MKTFDEHDRREGPDPRVLFAAERTFLAWIRTGLGLMGLGFIVARFGLFLREIAALDRAPVSGLSQWRAPPPFLLVAWRRLISPRQDAAGATAQDESCRPRGSGLSCRSPAALWLTRGSTAGLPRGRSAKQRRFWRAEGSQEGRST